MPFQDDEEMYVIKRSGEKEIVSFDKILQIFMLEGLLEEYAMHLIKIRMI